MRDGLSAEEVARRTGKSRRTVFRWLALGAFREHTRHRRGSLDPHLPYVAERWFAGCRNVRGLWRELVARGYRGSYEALSQYVRRKLAAPPMSLPQQSQVTQCGAARGPTLMPRRHHVGQSGFSSSRWRLRVRGDR